MIPAWGRTFQFLVELPWFFSPARQGHTTHWQLTGVVSFKQCLLAVAAWFRQCWVLVGSLAYSRPPQESLQATAAKRWSGTSCPGQRSLQATQVCCPATADSVQFYLLCCQPGSVPTSLSARTSRLSPWCPCRLSAWPGQTIHMASRTC